MPQDAPQVNPFYTLPAPQDPLHVLVASWPFDTGQLSASACHLANYLIRRAVRYPSPLWFASRLHLAILARMLPQGRSDAALVELIEARLVTLAPPVETAGKGGEG